MEVLLLRHGESTSNFSHRHQGKSEPLSEEGKVQAVKAAHKLSAYDIKQIFSSDFVRAQQTASIISSHLKNDTIILPSIGEVMTPSELHGKCHSDPTAIYIKEQMRIHYHDPTWKFSDEETFWDAKERALQVLFFLENQQLSSCLLVTHGAFIKILVAVMAYGSPLDSYTFSDLSEALGLIENTALSIHSFHSDGWKIQLWKDQSFNPLNTKKTSGEK